MSSDAGEKRAYLLSGQPGCGKTTIIRKALAAAGPSAGGFYTEEVRDRGARRGFRIITVDGGSAVLADVAFRSRYRVGKYGVDVNGMEEVAVPAIREALRGRDIVVIDEIGKMELFSSSFREAVIEALESGRKVVGTIMLASHPWVDEVKRRGDVHVATVTRDNRGEVLGDLLQWIGSPTAAPELEKRS
jgi:nucleoside-triphosphatase